MCEKLILKIKNVMTGRDNHGKIHRSNKKNLYKSDSTRFLRLTNIVSTYIYFSINTNDWDSNNKSATKLEFMNQTLFIIILVIDRKYTRVKFRNVLS